MYRICHLAITSASLLLVAPHAVAAQYSFANIADSRGPLSIGSGGPVGDTGTVAFIGYQGGVAGTYVGSGGAVQPVVRDLSTPPDFVKLGLFALNESGVATAKIECCDPRHGEVLLYEASGTHTIDEVTGGATLDAGFFFPAINNSGAVAFGTYYWTSNAPTSIEASITRWFDGTSTTVLETAAGFTFLGDVQLNDAGEVAFQGYTGVALEDIAIYRTNGTTITTIADAKGPLHIQQTFDSLAINDSGAVAFWSRLDAGGEGIFVGDGGPLATVAIADPTTPFYEIERDIDINNQGTVAFKARLWNGSYGIYAGGDPVNDKVVEIGDFLFGQRVSGLGRPYLNNLGDIAFWFSVLDPREPDREWSGIALAVRQSAVSGDFNQDGTVDAADYIVWRKGLGTTQSQSDYTAWRANFGESSGSGFGANANSAVPEPSTLALILLSGVGYSSFPRPRGRHGLRAQNGRFYCNADRTLVAARQVVSRLQRTSAHVYKTHANS